MENTTQTYSDKVIENFRTNGYEPNVIVKTNNYLLIESDSRYTVYNHSDYPDVYLEESFKDCMEGPLKVRGINWCAMGTQDVVKTQEFIEQLKEAVVFVYKINEYVSDSSEI